VWSVTAALVGMQLLRITALIDCPGGSVPDPSHYPSSRCVLPQTAAQVEASGNEQQ
jgi:hypothetical protein